MSGFFDSKDFTFTCPHCKRSVKTTVARTKRSDYKCPHCDAKYNTSDFRREIEKADRGIEELKRSLSNIKINIKI